MFTGFGFFESVFPVVFGVMFVVVIGVILASAVRGARQWHRNEASPRLTVEAVVRAKREDVSYTHHNTADNTMMQSSHTTYYVTFEVESGDRMELSVAGKEYGMLAEGDRGRLTFQGTRYQGFERNG